MSAKNARQQAIAPKNAAIKPVKPPVAAAKPPVAAAPVVAAPAKPAAAAKPVAVAKPEVKPQAEQPAAKPEVKESVKVDTAIPSCRVARVFNKHICNKNVTTAQDLLRDQVRDARQKLAHGIETGETKDAEGKVVSKTYRELTAEEKAECEAVEKSYQEGEIHEQLAYWTSARMRISKGVPEVLAIVIDELLRENAQYALSAAYKRGERTIRYKHLAFGDNLHLIPLHKLQAGLPSWVQAAKEYAGSLVEAEETETEDAACDEHCDDAETQLYKHFRNYIKKLFERYTKAEDSKYEKFTVSTKVKNLFGGMAADLLNRFYRSAILITSNRHARTISSKVVDQILRLWMFEGCAMSETFEAQEKTVKDKDKKEELRTICVPMYDVKCPEYDMLRSKCDKYNLFKEVEEEEEIEDPEVESPDIPIKPKKQRKTAEEKAAVKAEKDAKKSTKGASKDAKKPTKAGAKDAKKPAKGASKDVKKPTKGAAKGEKATGEKKPRGRQSKKDAKDAEPEVAAEPEVVAEEVAAEPAAEEVAAE